jgi:nucleoside-diphosphate-sugar epimerase
MITNLVLGSEGFVGNSFCTFLENQGERVVRFDIERSANEDCRHSQLPLDVVDRVYFLAWDVGGAKYLYKNKTQFRQLDWNLRILLNVMSQIQAARIPFLFASSQLAQEFDTVYGATKRLGEVWTQLLGGTRVRFWNVYGPIEEFSERSHVISDFVHQAWATGKIKMLTTGEELRQFIHIDDLCRAMHMALSQNLKSTYDITSFEWISVLDVAKIIASELSAEIILGRKTGRTPVTPLVGKIPGWFPEIDIRTGLRRMIVEIKGEERRERPVLVSVPMDRREHI